MQKKFFLIFLILYLKLPDKLQINLSKYKTFIFDCDGVILNSNFIKAECFYLSVLEFGEDVASSFKEYHSKAGGVSRTEKYDHLIKNILPKFSIKITEKNFLKIKLITKYESILKSLIIKAELSPYLKRIKTQYKNSNWIMISGAEQNELRHILKSKGVDNLFDQGIFGSPKTKYSILKEKIKDKKIIFPAIFFGDSKLDFHASLKFNIDFIFLYEWTDLIDWEIFCNINKIRYSKNLFTASS